MASIDEVWEEIQPWAWNWLGRFAENVERNQPQLKTTIPQEKAFEDLYRGMLIRVKRGGIKAAEIRIDLFGMSAPVFRLILSGKDGRERHLFNWQRSGDIEELRASLKNWGRPSKIASLVERVLPQITDIRFGPKDWLPE